MEIQFEKLNTPNFVRTNKGSFAIGDLSREEIDRYIELWKFSLLHKWESSQN